MAVLSSEYDPKFQQRAQQNKVTPGVRAGLPWWGALSAGGGRGWAPAAVLHLRLLSCESPESRFCVLLTGQAPLLTGGQWDPDAVLIHTPALAASLPSRRPALHRGAKIQLWLVLAGVNMDVSWSFDSSVWGEVLPVSSWRNLACHSWACRCRVGSRINGRRDFW